MPQPCSPKTWGSKIQWFTDGFTDGYKRKRQRCFFFLLSCLLFSYFFCSPTLYWTCSHFPQSPSFFFIISIYNFLLRSTMTIIYIFWILTIIYQLVFLPYQLLMTCQICKQILRSIINAKTIFYPYLCWPLLIPSLCSSFSKLISMEQ